MQKSYPRPGVQQDVAPFVYELFLELEKANIRWFLSIDNEDIPENIKEKGKTTYRSIKINNQEINQIEPYVKAIEGIIVPEESVVSFREVAESFLKELEAFGVKVKYNSQIKKYNYRQAKRFSTKIT